MSNLYEVRKDYGLKGLNEDDIDQNPLVQFDSWFQEASKTEGDEVNAFTLSTIGEDGLPEGRVVLLKLFDENGFIFFTNYNSRKAQDIASNPFASMTFYWKSKEQQIRVKGGIKKISPEQSDDYYHTRPVGSRVGAWASPQSTEIQDRSVLEEKYREAEQRFDAEESIARPDFWGGYIIEPIRIEFWQGRSSRLHDRLVYVKQEQEWKVSRLAP